LTKITQLPCLDHQLAVSLITGQFADNQLAVSQVADWSTRGLVNSLTANYYKLQKYYTIFLY